jgi:uncharacterized membrane protein
MERNDRYRRLTVLLAGALVVLGVAWEMWLAPARPGGSLLVLKVLPLAAAMPALVRGRVRAYQWWSMLILFYVCAGVVRGMSDADALSRTLGWIEAALATGAYAAILLHVRAARAPSPPAPSA